MILNLKGFRNSDVRPEHLWEMEKLMRWNTRTLTQLKHVCTLAICNFDIDLCLECNNKVWPAGGAIKASMGLQLHTLCCIPRCLLLPTILSVSCQHRQEVDAGLYSTNRWWWRHGSRLVSSGDIMMWLHCWLLPSPLWLLPTRSSLPVTDVRRLLLDSPTSCVSPTTFSTRRPFSEIWARLRLTAASVFGVIHMFYPAWRRSSGRTRG